MGAIAWRALLVGWGILLAAIVLNVIAGQLGIATWYEYLGRAGDRGIAAATASLSIAERLFLFLLYPGLLGLVAHLVASRG